MHLHLFDYYLPSTLSWVCSLLEAAGRTAPVGIAAPWIVPGPFDRPGFRYYRFPPQDWLFPGARTEWDHVRWRRLFTGTQRFLPTYRWWLFHTLKRQPPEVLHAHFGPVGVRYLPLAKALKRPLVVTFYGFDYTKLPRQRPALYAAYRALFAGAARVVAASSVGADLLEQMGCPREKLAVVPPCPRLDAFPFRQRHKAAGHLRLVQVATFTPKKGHLITLEAFRRALADCPGLQLTLAGEQCDAAVVGQVRDYLDRYRLHDRVVVRGMVPHTELSAFLNDFDAFIHPSCHAADGDHEASPVVIIEAQATGLPVLASRHFDLHNQVVHGQTGFLAPEGDAGQLANHIRQLYAMDDAAYSAMAHAARRHVETHYDVALSARRLLDLYAQLR